MKHVLPAFFLLAILGSLGSLARPAMAQLPVIQLPQPATMEQHTVGTMLTPSNRTPASGAPYEPWQEMIRRQQANTRREVDEHQARQREQQRQARALIEEAVETMNQPQKPNPSTTVLQESDLSAERRMQLHQALAGYDQAFGELASMYRDGQPISIKRAVYLVEDAYLDHTLPYGSFCQSIKELVNLSWQQIPAYHRAKPTQRQKYLALYRVMCDTTWRVDAKGQRTGVHLPMTYDFEDYRGEKDYRHMFVTKLLEKGTGQCHSLPLLYKILAEEMHVPAYISYAPNHTYIQHPDEQGNWYNLELTNGRYVTKASLMDFGYIKAAALKNRVYMDTISLRQTVGACLIDLALGYDAKFGAFGKDAFIEQCCQLVLSREPNHIQALLVQANLITAQLQRAIRQSSFQSPQEVTPDSQVYQLHQRQQQIYARIDQLGYAEMPKAQYEAWRASLGREQFRRQNQAFLQQMQPRGGPPRP